MKLYFYTANIIDGITVEVCDAIEKPKTYCKENDFFPIHLSRVRKEDIGKFIDWCIVLTEPNFEYAKEVFRNRVERRIADKLKEIEKLKAELKIINESEERK